MTLAEALAVISTVNFSEAKPKQFENISTFLEGAIAELVERERAVTSRERTVSLREGNATHREQAVEAREATICSVERVKRHFTFWRGDKSGFSPHA